MFSIFNFKNKSKNAQLTKELVNEQDDEFSVDNPSPKISEQNVNVACASNTVRDNLPNENIETGFSKKEVELDLGNIITGPLQPILNVSTLLSLNLL